MRSQLAFALATTVLAGPALADHDLRRTDLLPAYKQECAACHTAYPPGLLPAESWQRIMGQLKTHFGTDASLEPAQVREIARWLDANAATGRRAEPPPQDRITRSAWFARKHREVAPAAWQRASIRTASNCAACHTRTDQGNFDEHAVRIPR